MSQNLIPLHLDRTTGKLVAKDVLGGQIPDGFRSLRGYIHLQQGASTHWVINHNGNSDDISVQVFLDNGEMVLPDMVYIIDESTIHIDFSAAVTGKALLTIFAYDVNDENNPHVSL